MTGATGSPLRSILAAHLVAATLLGSYRTGLKLALWNTLLILVAFRAVADGLVPGADPATATTVPAATAVAGMWVVTLTTAACAAASERLLRRQRADLSSLSSMAARIEERPTASEIPVVLLDELCATFGFGRGAVLVGAGGGRFRVGASTDGVEAVDGVDADATIDDVVGNRATRLVRSLHRNDAGSLASLLPNARNVVLLPLAAPSGPSLGIVVLERRGRVHGIPRWTIVLIERFVAHAALALANARLRDERDAQLETIQLLERDLRVHAEELEERVASRTAELRETVEVLRETDEQRRRLLAHVVRVAEEERRRIANDVHDDPVQKLVALKMRLELLVKSHPHDDDMARAKTAVEGVIHSMRHLLFDLRPPVLDEADLDEALRYLLEQSELPFAWSVEGTVDHEPGEQARVILYRIAQEAVANARKHSQAERLVVRLESRDGGTWLEIADDGVGFLPQDAVVAAPGHLGLAAMRERAEIAGGTCELRSLPNAGTTVTVWLPRQDDVAPVEPLDRIGRPELAGRARAS
jgi:signal transduction histidine kinase